ncbi:hypothetical protein [Desulfuribacillus stibiiarsenatis]
MVKISTICKPQNVIPIHTERAYLFSNIFDNVRIVKDGEEVSK